MALFSFMFGLTQFVASFTSAFTQNLIEFALKHMEWRSLFNGVGVGGIVLLVVGSITSRTASRSMAACPTASAPFSGR